ncbi:Alpha/beta hydrolase fold-3 [Macleaya cordata]|uniref:Alpha/beta hydrolase fold-3 n=1 Tax=Macleaya cordata TaxID=56857 RepID=A0A200PPN1_MACCD|nr:Alpha/beta hydrolase fold-3 [Macleaya cordata]
MADNQSLEPVNSSTTIFSFEQNTNGSTNPYEILKIVHNSDDTLIRNLPIPMTPTTDENSKDIPLNAKHKTWIRLFRPTQLQGDNFSATNKLPVIIYIHGGGFILFSAASTMFHDFCKSMATHLSALIVSVEYRLAPENRLPAAYDDAMEAINWVQNQALDAGNGEPWLRDYADFSKSFIMGCSAGGNIAYHACLRALELDLEPVKINGLILHQPFIGGLKRTESEIRLINDRILPCPVTDLMWELALPIGANRDHVYCNPMVDDETINGGKLGLIKRCLVVGCDGDPLIDRQIELMKMLEGKGVKVESWMEEGGFHGIAFLDPQIAEILFGKLKIFIFSDDITN